MLLVNSALKFQMAILQTHCYILLKKCQNPAKDSAKDSHIYSTRNKSVFAFEVNI